ncbi:cation diffusion facilitator family transporter [Peribacillus frigoritolerans]|uniref:cation diffusion facilitator family transporter n=1 Tax=Peribacillus frigoritolerans TaxID=450367 RepID=UPI0007BFA4FA|nr:cation diffusion facilitator family transporter [Peribacillus frigoritolerans]USK65641.1 cation diffusion facilitator family transporter [Peribacillus frigoritolerans]
MGHSHSHSHSEGHSHNHGQNVNKRALKLSFLIIASYMIIEVIGGIITNSLALLSDAGHMLSDATALGFSYLAMTFGERKATEFKTFGFKRFEVLAAFINGLTLIGISVYIFWEAYRRFSQPPEVMSTGMLTVAIIGLVVNILAAYILMKGDTSGNLNMKSAFLHVIGDLLGSVGAITAALLIMFFGWDLADPIASVLVAILIIVSAYRVTRESIHILMEGVPTHIKINDVQKTLTSIKNVVGVHDLHVWAISSDIPSLSCHILIEDARFSQAVLKDAKNLLHEKFDIEHTTIQIDTPEIQCDIKDH